MPYRVETHRPRASVGAAAPPIARAPARLYERAPLRAEDKRFYKSPAWRALRLIVLRDRPLCADCEKIGLLVAAAHVHHKVDRKADEDLSLDEANLEGLCVPCHNRKRRKIR